MISFILIDGLNCFSFRLEEVALLAAADQLELHRPSQITADARHRALVASNPAMREKTDDVQEQSGITQHLKLLGDFGFDVLAGPMPFIGVLQPIRPARRAVGASGFALDDGRRRGGEAGDEQEMLYETICLALCSEIR
ncbi:MAG: hypothetical protein ABSD57_11370 [Verrucomicrobiota bacterium]